MDENRRHVMSGTGQASVRPLPWDLPGLVPDPVEVERWYLIVIRRMLSPFRTAKNLETPVPG